MGIFLYFYSTISNLLSLDKKLIMVPDICDIQRRIVGSTTVQKGRTIYCHHFLKLRWLRNCRLL